MEINLSPIEKILLLAIIGDHEDRYIHPEEDPPLNYNYGLWDSLKKELLKLTK